MTLRKFVWAYDDGDFYMWSCPNWQKIRSIKLKKAAIYKAGIAYRQTRSDSIEVLIKGDEKEAREIKEEQRHESVEGDDQSNRRSRKKKKSSKVFSLISS